MTRINLVPPKELSDRHLVAEYHELPRIFGLVKKAIAAGKDPEAYRQEFKNYTMGTGHVKFFYGRLKFIADRQISLIEEMLARKMRPSYGEFETIIRGIPKEWFGDWKPDEKALEISRKRIAERIKEQAKKKRKVITPYNEHLMNEKGEVK